MLIKIRISNHVYVVLFVVVVNFYFKLLLLLNFVYLSYSDCSI